MPEQPSPESPARGMDSIAHLFLSQARNGARKPPARIKPAAISEPEDTPKPTNPSAATNPTDPEEIRFSSKTLSSPSEICYTDNNREFSGDEEDHLLSDAAIRNQSSPDRPFRFHGVLVWTDHLSNAVETAVQFSRQWAQKNETAGLLRLDAKLTELFEYRANDPGGSELSTKEWQELLGESNAGSIQLDESLKPALTDLAERCDSIILSADAELRQQASDLLEHCRHAVIVTTPEPNDMLAAYKTIKRLSPATWEDKDIALFVSGAEDEASARGIYEKLAKTAWDFLAVDLSWGGWTQPIENVAEKHLAAVETREDVLEELVEVLSPHIETAQLFTQEQDELVEELELKGRKQREKESGEWSVVSGQEEESSQFTVHSSQQEEKEEEKPEVVSEEREEEFEERAEEEVEAKERLEEASMPTQAWAWHPAAGMAPEKGEVLSPVGVGKLPRSDGELADVLQLALPGWLKGIVTPMILPLGRSSDMDKSVRFLVDGNGRLFVLGVSLTASEDAFTKALQGRKWLEDNLSMILSACPQVRIDRSLEAGVILVAGGDVRFLQESVSQISEFPIQVKQLHLLQNESGSSILVI
jgi:hypothetical protein